MWLRWLIELHLFYMTPMQSPSNATDDEENIRLEKLVGSNIMQDLQNIDQPTDVYPAPSSTDLEKREASVPETLKHLIAYMFTESCNESAKMKKKPFQISICHVILQAAGKTVLHISSAVIH